jgi:hypothetical protein
MTGKLIKYQNIVGKSNGPSLSEVIQNLKDEIEWIKLNGIKTSDSGSASGNTEPVNLSTINADIIALKQITAPLSNITSAIASLKSDLMTLKTDVGNLKGTLSSVRSAVITQTNSLKQLTTSVNNQIALLQMAVLAEKDERNSQDQNILYKIDFLFEWLFRATSDEVISSM